MSEVVSSTFVSWGRVRRLNIEYRFSDRRVLSLCLRMRLCLRNEFGPENEGPGQCFLKDVDVQVHRCHPSGLTSTFGYRFIYYDRHPRRGPIRSVEKPAHPADGRGWVFPVWNFQPDIEEPSRYRAKCLVWPNASRSAISIWQPAQAERTANVKRCTGHRSGSSEGDVHGLCGSKGTWSAMAVNMGVQNRLIPLWRVWDGGCAQMSARISYRCRLTCRVL